MNSITENELNKILSSPYDTIKHIIKDFSNILYEKLDFLPYGELLGKQTIEEFTFFGVAAGNDGELPVYFIVYENFSLYMPKDGNMFNHKTGLPIGRDREYDKTFLGINKFDLAAGEILLDTKKIKQDITKRLCNGILE